MVARPKLNRLTREQIMFGLRECFAGFLKGQPIDVNADFVALVTENGFDADALMFDGIFAVQQYFGFRVTDLAWVRLFQVELGNGPQRVTFNELVDFIAEQLTITVSFEPIAVVGRVCRPAGVFTGLEKLARNVQPSIEKFAPSTPIRERFELYPLLQYFGLLKWLTEGASPPARDPLSSHWRQLSDYAALFIGITSCCVYFCLIGTFIQSAWAAWLMGISGAALVAWISLVYFAGHWLLQRFFNPLPPGVETFGDLAKLIADRMEANRYAGSHAAQVAR